MKPKAVLLLSGGLDSTVVGNLMLEMGVEIYAFNMVSPFCTCTRKGQSCHQATHTAKQLGIPIKIIAVKDEYLRMVENPKYGWGKGTNPCIDCRILLFKKAKKYADEIGASFFVSGEVLKQRPKSQFFESLQIIEEEAGLKGLIVRPLSAKLLPSTIPEQEGWVDRDKLLSVSGRCRKVQMDLAEKYGINDYPCPAGGCLLTNPQFSQRAKDAIKYGEWNMKMVPLLKLGRHFRLPNGSKLIVGRNEKENKDLLGKNDSFVIIEAVDYKSPIGLFKGMADDFSLSLCIVLRYSDCSDMKGKVRFTSPGESEKVIETNSICPEEIEKWRI